MWCRCGAVGEDGDEQLKMLTMQMRLWSCNGVTLRSTGYLDMIYSVLGIPILRAPYIYNYHIEV
jgi:hypothetical protein